MIRMHCMKLSKIKKYFFRNKEGIVNKGLYKLNLPDSSL